MTDTKRFYITLQPVRRDRFRKRSLFFLFPLLAFVFLLSGCNATPKRLWLNAPDWSRAQLLGVTMSGDAPVFALDADGATYFLLAKPLESGEEQQSVLQAIALDARGLERWSRSYPEVALARPDELRAYKTTAGVALLWIDRERLYRAEIDPDSGQMITPPTLLSGETRVGSYDAVVTEDGRLTIWFGGPRVAPGLYRIEEAEGEPNPVLIDPQGTRPRLDLGPDGDLHALWVHYPMGQTGIDIFYWIGRGKAPAPEDAVLVASPKAQVSSLFIGPELGLDRNMAYVTWAIEVRTGLNAGLVQARYVSFPRERPDLAASAKDLVAPSDYHLEYQPWPESEIRAGRRAPISPPLKSRMTQFFFLSTPVGETASIQRQKVTYTMRQEAFQTSLLFWRDGHPTSYQLLSFTRSDTLSPAMAMNRENYLYAAWLERGAQGFDVYFASTEPQVAAEYERLSLADYGSILGQTLFGMVMGALLLPFAMMWMIVPVILFLITFPLRRDNLELSARGNLISLTLAIAGYWIAKLSTLASLREFVPFSPWIPIIPEWLAPVLQVITPLGILSAGLVAAWAMTYRRGHYSALLFLLVYLAVDAVLTTAIYGPIFLAMN